MSQSILFLFQKRLFVIVARDVEAGKAATEEINREYKNVRFHQLDIEDEESIERFADHLFETHGGLDVLINNAAINIKVQFITTLI